MLRIVGVFKKCATFATANEKRLVPWMSGLVSGLQNRVRRFESARNLNNPSQIISERDFFWVRSARALSNGWKRSNVKI